MQRAQFERLALEHLDAVYRMAWQLTRNSDRAEDLVQEAYLRALKPEAVERFTHRDNPASAAGETESDSVRSWLFTITHNTFYSLGRKSRAQRAFGSTSSRGEPESGGDEASGLQNKQSHILTADPPPMWESGAIDWEHVDQRLKAAVAELADEYRLVLLMWGVQGMKYREIAETLEIPIGTVMSRLFRARKVLGEALGGPEGAAAELGVKQSHVGREHEL